MTNSSSTAFGHGLANTVVAAMLGFLAFAIAGCASSENGGKCNCPRPPREATIDLGCVRFDSTSVQTTGPCVVCPATTANGSIPDGSHCGVSPDATSITLMSTGAGTCHAEVTFASGTTSSLDIDFVSEWRACGSDPHGCGIALIPVTHDGGVGRFSLPEVDCDAGMTSDQ